MNYHVADHVKDHVVNNVVIVEEVAIIHAKMVVLHALLALAALVVVVLVPVVALDVLDVPLVLALAQEIAIMPARQKMLQK